MNRFLTAILCLVPVFASAQTRSVSVDPTTKLVGTSTNLFAANSNLLNRSIGTMGVSNAVTSINGMTNQVQTIAVGTSGSDVNVTVGSGTTTVQIPTASGSTRGAVSAADWTTFNSKVGPTRAVNVSSPLAGGGALSSDLTITIPAGASGQSGYLTSSDWARFNSGQIGSLKLTNFAALANSVGALTNNLAGELGWDPNVGAAGGSGLTGDQYQIPAGVSAGATSFTISPANNGITKGGFVIIDPGNTNCDVRYVSSVAGNVITVLAGTVTPMLSFKAEFISSSKTIRVQRPIKAVAITPYNTILLTNTVTNFLTLGTGIEILGTTNYYNSSYMYRTNMEGLCYVADVLTSTSVVCAINYTDTNRITLSGFGEAGVDGLYFYSAANNRYTNFTDGSAFGIFFSSPQWTITNSAGTSLYTNKNVRPIYGGAWDVDLGAASAGTSKIGAYNLTGLSIDYTGNSQVDDYSGAFNALYYGQTIQISGAQAAGNNGFFTVESISRDGSIMTVRESLTDENSGNSLTIADRLGAHAANTRVIWTPSLAQGLIPLTFYGCFPSATQVASDATNNSRMFQRANRQAKYALNNGANGVYIPSGSWFFAEPLRPEAGTAIYGAIGVGVNATILKASDLFPFDNTDEVFMIMPTKEGRECRYKLDGGTSRWYLGDFRMDGRLRTYSQAILASTQQPDYWGPIYIVDFIGHSILYGGVAQQLNARYLQMNIQSDTTGICTNHAAIRLGSFAQLYLDSFNSEGTPSSTLHDNHNIVVEGQRERTFAAAPYQTGGGYRQVIDHWHDENHYFIAGDSSIYVDPAVVGDMLIKDFFCTGSLYTFAYLAAPASVGCTKFEAHGTYPTGILNTYGIWDVSRGVTNLMRETFDRKIDWVSVSCDSQNFVLVRDGAYGLAVPGADGGLTQIGLGSIPDASTNQAANIRLVTSAAGRRSIATYSTTSGGGTNPVFTVNNEGDVMAKGIINTYGLATNRIAFTDVNHALTALEVSTNLTLTSDGKLVANPPTGDISEAIIIDPASGTRNTIQPTSDVVGLRSKSFDGSSIASLFNCLLSDDTVVFQITGRNDQGKALVGINKGPGTPQYPLDVSGIVNATGFDLSEERFVTITGGTLRLADGLAESSVDVTERIAQTKDALTTHNSNDVLLAAISHTGVISAQQGNIRTNISLMDVVTNDLVIGTRYTNENRRAFLTASVTLNGAAAGTAKASLYVEHGPTTITNKATISAGPLASLTTIEELSQMIGPGAIYYIIDETSGAGGSIAIVPNACSLTKF